MGLGLLLSALTRPALAMEIAIKQMITSMSSGKVSAINSAQKIQWFEQSQDVDSPTEISIKKKLKNQNSVEYEYQSLNMAHRGQFARETCSFFGCAYVGTGLLTGYQTADTVKVKLSQHSFTYHLSNDNLHKNLALLFGLDILTADASAAGLNFYEKKTLLIPTPKIGAKAQIDLKPTLFLITKISYSTLSHGESSMRLAGGEISVSYRHSKQYFFDFGYQKKHFYFNYINKGRILSIDDELYGPFIRLGISFE